ncbi:hypothetical protein ACN28S_28070 [Cystobacter fuscus]
MLIAQAGRGAPQLAGAALLIGGVIVVSLGFVGALLWYLLRFSLLAPVLAMEDLSAARSFRRSGELLSGRVEPGFIGRVTVRAMLLVTVVSLILLAVSALFGLPALVVQFAYRDPSQPLLSPAPRRSSSPRSCCRWWDRRCSTPWGSSCTRCSTWTCACAARAWTSSAVWTPPRPPRPARGGRMSLGLALLWLAALPCPDAERDIQELTELARSEPEAMEGALEALEARWQGLPLRAPGDDTPFKHVETVRVRLQGVCTPLEEENISASARTTDRARLEEILSRPEFAQARQRQGDVLQRLLRMVRAGWRSCCRRGARRASRRARARWCWCWASPWCSSPRCACAPGGGHPRSEWVARTWRPSRCGSIHRGAPEARPGGVDVPAALGHPGGAAGAAVLAGVAAAGETGSREDEPGAGGGAAGTGRPRPRHG